MTPGERSSIDDLKRSLDDLTSTLKRRNAWRRLLAMLVGLALVALIVAVAVILANSFTSRATLDGVKDTLRIVKDVTGEQAQAQSQQSQADVVRALLAEGDCRHRRAAAGLPAPDDSVSCKDQTPPSVYPGA